MAGAGAGGTGPGGDSTDPSPPGQDSVGSSYQPPASAGPGLSPAVGPLGRNVSYYSQKRGSTVQLPADSLLAAAAASAAQGQAMPVRSFASGIGLGSGAGGAGAAAPDSDAPDAVGRGAAAATAAAAGPASASGSGVTWSQVLPTPVGVQDDRRALHTVNVALFANLAIFVAKLGVWVLSGSSSMLAEAVHSLVDCANQVLLRVGVMGASRKPNKLHPYGFYRDKFVISLISAVGILCLGGGITMVHGISELLRPHPHDLVHLAEGLFVLGISFIIEGYSLSVAVRAVSDGARASGAPFWSYVSSGRDPTSIAVMMEDAAAVSGLAIAACCTYLAHRTGLIWYDALGSVLVGSLLAVTAVFLIRNNRQLLIGRAMSPVEAALVLKHLERDPVVAAVYDAKSEELGPGLYRFKAEIAFAGDQVMERHVTRNPGRLALMRSIREAAASGDEKRLERELKRLGRHFTGALGYEIDRLELEIRSLVPGLRHVDLEPDRGRAFGAPPPIGGMPSVVYDNREVRPDVSKDSYWLDTDGDLASWNGPDGLGGEGGAGGAPPAAPAQGQGQGRSPSP